MPSGEDPDTPDGIVLRYFNAQLAENHITARHWYNVLKEDRETCEEQRNLYAWARYCLPVKGKNGNTVKFTFSKPSLTFLCHHDARIDIVVKSLEGLLPEQNEVITEMLEAASQFSYRVATRHCSTGIHVLECNFDNAKIINPTAFAYNDSQSKLRYEVERYLLSYLQALQKGGLNFLFFPPGFSEVGKCPAIDFSRTVSQEWQVPLDDIFGCTVQMVNGYLSLLWYKCAFVASERDGSQARDRSSSLAAYKCWLSSGPDGQGWNVSLTFGEPTVIIVCTREVRLHFALTKVRFHDSCEDMNNAERNAVYTDWAITMMVDIVAASRTAISIRPGSARCVEFKTSPASEVNNEHESAFKLFLGQYFEVAMMHLEYIFYKTEAEQIDFGSTRDDTDRTCDPSNNIKDTTMGGLDVIIAMSQTSINAQVRRIFEMHESTRTRWVQDDSGTFVMEIAGITVRLLDSKEALEAAHARTGGSVELHCERAPDGEATPIKSLGTGPRAIITIHVAEATLKQVFEFNDEMEWNPVDESHTLRGSQLAFEVEVKHCDYWDRDQDHPTPNTPPYPQPPARDDSMMQDCSKDYYVLQHIYLDLQNAQFSPKYSPWVDDYVDPVKRRAHMTLAQHIKEHYFRQLRHCEIDILASIPLYNKNAAPGFNRFTSMAYQTFAVETTTPNERSTVHSEQILFVLGMVDCKPFPKVNSFKPSASWPVHGRASYGTLVISKDVFHSRMLPLLAHINALTTLVPIPPQEEGTHTSEDIVRQWEKHPEYKGKVCKWRHADATSKFKWTWTHQWREEACETVSYMTRDYLIRCETHNELNLPDTSISTGPLEIRISGSTNLKISKKFAGDGWSTEASAKWSIVIGIKPSARGNIDFEISHFENNVDQPPPETSSNVPDVHAILHNLLTKEDLDNILRPLQELQGEGKYFFPASSSFTLGNPMSNPDGDLIFELQDY